VTHPEIAEHIAFFPPTVAPVRASSTPSETAIHSGTAALPSPANDFVAILRQEHIALKLIASYWPTMHRKAVDRFQWRELRYSRILRELKVSGAKSNVSGP
jgi:hypothetical protein